SWITIIFILAVGPATAAGGIVEEAERGTLGLLLLSRAGSLGIAAAKLLSRVILLLSFVIVAIPLFAAGVLLGGVGMDEVAGVAQIALGLALFTPAAGAIATTLVRKSLAGIAAGYAIIWIPLPWLIAFLTPAIRAQPWLSLVTGLGAAIVALAVVAARVRTLAVPGGASRRAPRPGPRRWVQGNPVAWKESRRRALRYRGLEVWGPIGCAAGLAVVFLGVGDEGPTIALSVFSYVLHYLPLFCALVLGAWAFVVEKDQGTLELLLATRLEPREIVRGKLLGFARRLGPVWLAWALLSVVSHLGTGDAGAAAPGWRVLLSFTSLLISASWLAGELTLASAISLRAKTRGGAIVGAFAAVVVVWIATMVLSSFLMMGLVFTSRAGGVYLYLVFHLLTVLPYAGIPAIIALLAWRWLSRRLRRYGVRAGG
ncbi:MAG: hypothetical protein JXP34_23545, partial [Planctomycetes bacterium]|nr:hypothetical protein [Planctomycetota bacterium]